MQCRREGVSSRSTLGNRSMSRCGGKRMAAKGVAERVQHQQQLPGWLQLEALPSVLQLHFAFAYQVLVVEQQKKLA